MLDGLGYMYSHRNGRVVCTPSICSYRNSDIEITPTC